MKSWLPWWLSWPRSHVCCRASRPETRLRCNAVWNTQAEELLDGFDFSKFPNTQKQAEQLCVAWPRSFLPPMRPKRCLHARSKEFWQARISSTCLPMNITGTPMPPNHAGSTVHRSEEVSGRGGQKNSTQQVSPLVSR